MVFLISVIIEYVAVKLSKDANDNTMSFVRCLWAGVQPTLGPSAETILDGPVRLLRERKGIGRCV